jgi:hypothetical protein
LIHFILSFSTTVTFVTVYAIDMDSSRPNREQYYDLTALSHPFQGCIEGTLQNWDHFLHDILNIARESSMHPIEQGTDKRMLVEINQIVKVLFADARTCARHSDFHARVLPSPDRGTCPKLTTQTMVDIDYYLPVVLEVCAHVTYCCLTVIVCPGVGVLA